MSDDLTAPEGRVYHPLKSLAGFVEKLERAAQAGTAKPNDIIDLHQLLVLAQTLEGYRSIITEVAIKCDETRRRVDQNQLDTAEAYRAIVDEFEIHRRRQIVFEADVRSALAGILEAVEETRKDEAHVLGAGPTPASSR